jgi:hypothetical protein
MTSPPGAALAMLDARSRERAVLVILMTIC